VNTSVQEVAPRANGATALSSQGSASGLRGQYIDAHRAVPRYRSDALAGTAMTCAVYRFIAEIVARRAYSGACGEVPRSSRFAPLQLPDFLQGFVVLADLI
jgi:hypothetical protein